MSALPVRPFTGSPKSFPIVEEEWLDVAYRPGNHAEYGLNHRKKASSRLLFSCPGIAWRKIPPKIMGGALVWLPAIALRGMKIGCVLLSLALL